VRKFWSLARKNLRLRERNGKVKRRRFSSNWRNRIDRLLN
jgi:hypothetical protein